MKFFCPTQTFDKADLLGHHWISAGQIGFMCSVSKSLCKTAWLGCDDGKRNFMVSTSAAMCGALIHFPQMPHVADCTGGLAESSLGRQAELAEPHPFEAHTRGPLAELGFSGYQKGAQATSWLGSPKARSDLHLLLHYHANLHPQTFLLQYGKSCQDDFPSFSCLSSAVDRWVEGVHEDDLNCFIGNA